MDAELEFAPGLPSLTTEVKLFKTDDLEYELPDDADDLHEALAAVKNRQGILPTCLKDTEAFQDMRIPEHLWQTYDVSDEEASNTLAEHEILLTISKRTLDGPCDTIVEFPWTPDVRELLLTLFLLRWDDVQAVQLPSDTVIKEVLADAAVSNDGKILINRIMKDNLPEYVTKKHGFGIVLRRSEVYRALIDKASWVIRPAPEATIWATMLQIFRWDPTPVLIITQTREDMSNLESANAHLRRCVSRWHAHLRLYKLVGDNHGRVITAPVIRVVGNKWTLMFAVDEGNETVILDGDLLIGDTSSFEGMYQLKAALDIIADWVETHFDPWLTDHLKKDLPRTLRQYVRLVYENMRAHV